MLVTIIADASYCPETKVTGYGFWVASERGKMPGEGVVEKKFNNNNESEMAALCNAMHQAYLHGIAIAGDKIIMQTDCQAAILAFEDKRKMLTKFEEEIVKWFKDFIHKYALLIEFRHVKGHTKNSGARFVTNVICDRRAKRAMRKARDSFKLQMLMRGLENE